MVVVSEAQGVEEGSVKFARAGARSRCCVGFIFKRHSGIVWGPGRFAGLLRVGDDCGWALLGNRAAKTGGEVKVYTRHQGSNASKQAPQSNHESASRR